MIYPTGQFVRSFAYPLVVLAGLLIFPDSSAQWEFGLVLFASLWLMAWFGHAALHFCAGEGPILRETLFLKACLGQFVLLVGWWLISPIIFTIREVIDLQLVLPLVVASLMVGMAVRAKMTRLSFLQSLRYDDLGRVAFTLFAAACLFKMGAYFSVRAGALGLDTHQHIYFAADLFDAGYLKLNAGTTPWIDRYPKGLHALTALWGLPGFGDHLGPSLKVMPSLQLLLVVFSFVELCALWLRRCDAQRLIMGGWWLLIAIGLAYVLFRGTRFAYPLADLNSTARLSSAAVLFLPGIVGCLMLLQGSRRMAVLASIALPLSGALSLKFHPALATAFFAVSVPLWAATAAWAIARERSTWSAAALGLLGGAVVGVAMIATDPFYLGLLASVSSTTASLLQASTGLQVLPQPSMISALPIFVTPMRLVAVIWHNLSVPGASVALHALPDSTMVISANLIAGIRAISWSVLGLWFLSLLFRKRDANEVWFGAAMPALVQMALLIGLWANGVFGRAVADVVGAITVEAGVLSTYVRDFSNILVLYSVPVHLVLSAALLCQMCSRFIGSSWRHQLAVRLSAAAIVALAVSLRWWPFPEAPLAETLGWWHPVKEAQLDAFQRLEQTIPEDSLILADATAAKLNEREEWILPVGETAAYLAIARRNYIFNVRLGEGYAYSFNDLDVNFCHGTPETARHFIKTHNIRYLFSVDRSVSTREQVLDKEYCGMKYSDIGVIYPPVATGADGMAFYRFELSHE